LKRDGGSGKARGLLLFMVAAAKLAVVAGAWLLVPAKCCRFVAGAVVTELR